MFAVIYFKLLGWFFKFYQRSPPSQCDYQLTYSVNEKLWFRWEIVVNDVVQHRDVNTASLGKKRKENQRENKKPCIHKQTIEKTKT